MSSEKQTAGSPTSIGRYRVLRALGSGGMGQVFLGEDLQPNGFRKLRAIKLVSFENQFLADRFVNEAVTGSLLNHPHIIQTHEYGTVVGEATGAVRGYLITELVEGLDLQHLQRAARRQGRSLPPVAAVSIALAIIDALEYAWDHARGGDGRLLRMIHRDIKPTNIMIDRNGVVKLMDLGIVRATTNPNPTLVQVPTGTLPYMAPEQIANGTLDLRTDLFALGAVVFELVMGERLYPASGAALAGEVTRADTTKRLEALSKRQPVVAQALGPALARDPAERYLDHASFRRALARALEHLGGPVDLGALVRSFMPEEQLTEVGARPVIPRGGGDGPPSLLPLDESTLVEETALQSLLPDQSSEILLSPVTSGPGVPIASAPRSLDTTLPPVSRSLESSPQPRLSPRARWILMVVVAGVALLAALLWGLS